MKIGVLSDTHNNWERVSAALEIFRERGVEVILHAGDVTSPDMLALFEGWKLVLALGNMDRDVSGLVAAAEAIGAERPRAMHSLSLDGVRLALCHGSDDGLLRHLISSGQYDIVVHGHTHRRRDERIGNTRVINPGALGGIRFGARTVCVLDTSGDLEFVEVK